MLNQRKVPCRLPGFFPGLEDLPVAGVGRGVLVHQLEGRVAAAGHDLVRERPQRHAFVFQRPHGAGVLGVVAGGHVDVRLGRGGGDDRLVLGRQGVPGGAIDVERERRPRLPPARVVVVLRDPVEAEFQVVVGADPLRRIDNAAFERGVDLAAGDGLHGDAEAAQNLGAETGNAHLDAAQFRQRVYLAAEPAAHLATGVAAGEVDDVEVGEHLAHQFEAAAVVEPGVLLPRHQAERHRRVEGERRVLAGVVVGRAVTELDRALLDGVQHAQRRHQLAGGVGAHPEAALGEALDPVGEDLRGAEDRVQSAREARGEAPGQTRPGDDSGRVARRGRCGAAAGGYGAGAGQRGRAQEVPAVSFGHPRSPFSSVPVALGCCGGQSTRTGSVSSVAAQCASLNQRSASIAA